MTDVFISYSRKDKDFAKKIIDKLSLSGKDAWVDWEGIPLNSPNWWNEIKTGIDNADNFIFLMSPNSMESVVCNLELDYAIENNKRIIPVILQDIASKNAFASLADFSPDEAMEERLQGQDILIIGRNNWQRLSHINWIYFREEDDFDTAYESLVDTVETNLAYVKAHKRYWVRAKEWDESDQREDLLIFGEEIIRAEEWLKLGQSYASDDDDNTNPPPTELHQQYIIASRKAEDERQHRLQELEDSRKRSEEAALKSDQSRRRATQTLAIVAVLSVILIGGALLFANTQVTGANNQVATADALVVTAENDVEIASTQVADADIALATVTQVIQNANNEADIASTQVVDANNLQATSVAIQATTEFQRDEAQQREDILTIYSDELLNVDDDPRSLDERLIRLIEQYPDDAYVFYIAGLAKDNLGDFEGAIADYDEAIRLDPEYAGAYNNRGLAKYDLGDLEGALADYDEAIRLDPEYALAYYNRGLAKFNLSDFEGALADYDEAIRLDPEYALAYTIGDLRSMI